MQCRILYLLLVVLLVLMERRTAEAIKCFVCDDCHDDTLLKRIEMCQDDLEDQVTNVQSPSTRRTTIRPMTLPQALDDTTSRITASTIKDIDGSDDREDELSTSSTQRTTRTTSRTTRSTTLRTTTTRRTTSVRTTTVDKDDEDEEDYDDEEDRRKRDIEDPIAPKHSDFVCYTLNYRINNTLVINRGCASMLRNNYLTCLSLHSGRDVENCQLCNKNACNRFKTMNSELPVAWDGATCPSASSTWIALILVVVVKSLF